MSKKMRAAFEAMIREENPSKYSQDFFYRYSQLYTTNGEYMERGLEPRWRDFQKGWKACIAAAKSAISGTKDKPVAWLTKESARHLKNGKGGSTKGTVPVHLRKTTVAVIPVFSTLKA